MDSLEFNKIIAALLIALLVGILSVMMAEFLVKPLPLEKEAYVIEVPESTGVGSAKEKILEPVTPLLASASLENGKEIFKRCTQCHTDTKGGQHKLGPNLWNVVGTKKGSRSDYTYSRGMQSQEGSWDYESLNAYLEKPRDYVPGTKMSFAGLRRTQERADVILYLRSLSDQPLPLP